MRHTAQQLHSWSMRKQQQCAAHSSKVELRRWSSRRRAWPVAMSATHSSSGSRGGSSSPPALHLVQDRVPERHVHRWQPVWQLQHGMHHQEGQAGKAHPAQFSAAPAQREGDRLAVRAPCHVVNLQQHGVHVAMSGTYSWQQSRSPGGSGSGRSIQPAEHRRYWPVDLTTQFT